MMSYHLDGIIFLFSSRVSISLYFIWPKSDRFSNSLSDRSVSMIEGNIGEYLGGRVSGYIKFLEKLSNETECHYEFY